MSAHSDPPLAESPYRVGPISRGSAFAWSALAVVGFIATTLLIRLALPPMNPEGVGVKLRYFAQHKDDFDTLIVGTSRLNYSIDPAAFDTIMRSAGRPMRTFNFGMHGMHPPENFYVLDEILNTHPRNLKWVVIELEDIVPTADLENVDTRRLRYWHDWRQTKTVLRKLLNPRGRSGTIGKLFNLVRSWRSVTLHVGLFAKELVSLGRGADVISGAAADEAKLYAVELGTNNDGYRPPREPMPAADAQKYEARLARECGSADTNEMDPYAEADYREAAARIRSIGAQPVFVVTPVLSQTVRGFRGSPPGAVLSFNDCRRYPQLYTSRVRVDEGHLSKEGAEEFTRLLA
ncbi:MAG TPA: hypothetical protein VGC85_02455, partial [Chthoniobacterales bacterium]